MFNSIASRYDLLNSILSIKQDKRWRKKLISQLPNKYNLTLLDVATGTGEVIIEAYREKKISTSIGIDISQNMLDIAKKKLDKEKIPTTLKCMSAENLLFDSKSVDCLTISFGLRNTINREKALNEFYRVLKPGGTLCILEFFSPPNRLLNKLFFLYMNYILPKIGGLLSQKEAYAYLPKSIYNFNSSIELINILEAIHFELKYKEHFIFQTCSLLCFEKK